MDGLQDTEGKQYPPEGINGWAKPSEFSKENLNIRATGAMKNDAGKPRFSLLTAKPLNDIIDVFEFGSKKYGDYNWFKGFPYLDLFNAAQRHLLAWLDGEDYAEDSGLHHLAHAAANMHMLLELLKTHPELDNRYKK